MRAGSSARPTSVDCSRTAAPPETAAHRRNPDVSQAPASPSAPTHCIPYHRPKGRLTVRIVFAGTPAAAVPSLEALLNSTHEVVAVISRPDAPAGRGRKNESSPVAALAREAGIELLTPATARAPEFVSALTDLAPDAAAVVAYGAILRQNVLDIPANGWVNLHFSLLPAWRGAAPVQAAIRAGDDITGATTFRLEAGLDTGPVYGVVTEDISATDTAGTLLRRLAVSGSQLLVATLDGLPDGTVAG